MTTEPWPIKNIPDSLDSISRAFASFGPDINLAKTKVLSHPLWGRQPPPGFKITINRLKLVTVVQFPCLVSVLSSNAYAEKLKLKLPPKHT